jgi:hypothetical protein
MRLRQAARQDLQTWRILFLGCLLHLAWGPLAAHADEPLQIGVAEVEITPPKVAGSYEVTNSLVQPGSGELALPARRRSSATWR